MTATLECWNCRADPGPGALCRSCGKLQPVPAGASAFDLFGLSPRDPVDATSLARRFHDRSRTCHPDRFSKADPREHRIAVERTTALNDAYRTLKDPLGRAEAVLTLNGLATASGPPGDRPAVDPGFLEQMLELRELVERARGAKDVGRLRSVAAGVHDRVEATIGRVENVLDAWRRDGDTAHLARAGHPLAELKYLQRLLDEAEAAAAEVEP